METKANAYFGKPDADTANEMARMGWDILPLSVTDGCRILYREVTIPKESELAKAAIRFYDDDRFRKIAFGKGVPDSLKSYYSGLGIGFSRVYDDKSGKRVWRLNADDPGFVETVTTWRLQFALDGENAGIFALCAQDFSFPFSYMAAETIREYASDEIGALVGAGIAHEGEVGNHA